MQTNTQQYLAMVTVTVALMGFWAFQTNIKTVNFFIILLSGMWHVPKGEHGAAQKKFGAGAESEQNHSSLLFHASLTHHTYHGYPTHTRHTPILSHPLHP